MDIGKRWTERDRREILWAIDYLAARLQRPHADIIERINVMRAAGEWPQKYTKQERWT